MPNLLSNPDELRAILEFQRLGWRRGEICRALRISQTTFYKRLALVRSIEALRDDARDDRQPAAGAVSTTNGQLLTASPPLPTIGLGRATPCGCRSSRSGG
jgi:hypothetical protein